MSDQKLITEEVKRKAIKKYFKPFPRWAVVIGIVGMLAAFFGVQKGLTGITILVLLFPLLLGGLRIAFYLRNKPSDQEMDEYIEEDRSKAKIKSLNKTSIDESDLVAESIEFNGPRLSNRAGAPVLFKRGKDGIARYNPIDITIIHMTENQLITYRACLDITTGNYLNESTDEYFYRDVVSVATVTESTTYIDNKDVATQLNESEVFKLTTSGGTAVEVFLRDPKLIEMMGGGEIPTSHVEKSIQAIRKMLREKKQG